MTDCHSGGSLMTYALMVTHVKDDPYAIRFISREGNERALVELARAIEKDGGEPYRNGHVLYPHTHYFSEDIRETVEDWPEVDVYVVGPNASVQESVESFIRENPGRIISESEGVGF